MTKKKERYNHVATLGMGIDSARQSMNVFLRSRTKEENEILAAIAELSAKKYAGVPVAREEYTKLYALWSEATKKRASCIHVVSKLNLVRLLEEWKPEGEDKPC